jgi:AraC-like DNA-binding protein
MTGPIDPQSPTMPRRVEAALRAHRAVLMRQDGASYQEIAETVGYSDRASAFRAILRYLSKLAMNEDVRGFREMEVQRLDALQLAWAEAAQKDIQAARLVLEIIGRRSRLLGLDRNERRIAGAVEASAVAELAAVSALSSHLIASMIAAGVPPEVQGQVITTLNERLALEAGSDAGDGEEDEDDDISVPE